MDETEVENRGMGEAKRKFGPSFEGRINFRRFNPKENSS